MFTLDELEALEKYAYSSSKCELEDFLHDDEIQTIQEGGTRATTLLNRIFIPKHNFPFKTIRFQHLYTEDFQLSEWLLGISDCLRYGSMLTVDIGFSYMVHKSPKFESRYHYLIFRFNLY